MNGSCLSPLRVRSIIGLGILICLLFAQSSIGTASSQASGNPISLSKVVIQLNEDDSVFLPVNFNRGSNATHEMRQWCGLDCVKWYWGGTNSLSLTMSRTASEEAAQRAIENLLEQFQGYHNGLYEEMDCQECGSPVFSWRIRRGELSDDIVQVSNHGSVWIMMVLRVNGDPDDFFRDYCQGEQCWQLDLMEMQFFLRNLMCDQHDVLGRNGYPPFVEPLGPIETGTPKLTPVTPPPDALHRLDFLSYSPVCELPCINGLEPGKSTVEEISPFFKRLGMVLTEPLSSDGMQCMDLSGIPGGIYYPYPPELCITWADNIVQYINLDLWNHPELFQMTRIASVLGTPEKILSLYSHGLGANGSPNYSIALHYPQKFLMIETQGYSHGDFPWEVCLSDKRKQTTRIIIYSQESEDEALYRFYGPESSWYPWNEELELSIQDLFERMKQKNTCIPYMK